MQHTEYILNTCSCIFKVHYFNHFFFFKHRVYLKFPHSAISKVRQNFREWGNTCSVNSKETSFCEKKLDPGREEGGVAKEIKF